jgi:SET domain-containing protein
MTLLFYIGRSTIHGKGVLAKQDIVKGTFIDSAIVIKSLLSELVNYEITQHFGKYLNHSKRNANIVLKYKNRIFYAVANKHIKKDSEILIDYDGPTIPFFIEGSKPHYKDN